MADTIVDITSRLAIVNARIIAAAERVGRDPGDITLVAVSKTMPPKAVRAAYEAGHRHFGENRVQEAEDKMAHLADLVDVHWHLVGHLQRNKVKPALTLFHLIESVDSPRLARAISKRALEQQIPTRVLLEVNVAGEESKYGFDPDQLLEAASEIVTLPNLVVDGLMTVAPAVDDAEQVRPIFRRLRGLQEDLRDRYPQFDFPHLSMGMTDDFEVAIEEGATIVRIGRAIFGPRTLWE